MNVNGMIAFDVTHQVEVPLERDVRVVPALNQDLHAAERLRLLDLGADLLERKRVSLAVLGSAIERAEAAIRYTNVRVVDVAIDDVGDRVMRMLLATDTVSLGSELEQRGIRVEIEDVLHGI